MPTSLGGEALALHAVGPDESPLSLAVLDVVALLAFADGNVAELAFVRVAPAVRVKLGNFSIADFSQWERQANRTRWQRERRMRPSRSRTTESMDAVWRSQSGRVWHEAFATGAVSLFVSCVAKSFASSTCILSAASESARRWRRDCTLSSPSSAPSPD